MKRRLQRANGVSGVMRFLQMEWHRHERDRNAWEIERAEMKARIAKTEGENRSNRKLQDSLSNHIKLLEGALKKEREKLKTSTTGQGSPSDGKASTSPQKPEDNPPPTEARPDGKRKSVERCRGKTAWLIVSLSPDTAPQLLSPGF